MASGSAPADTFSNLSIYVNGSNDSSGSLSSYHLPRGIEAFAPLILFEFVVAAVSNIILIVLILKARKVQSNTNVYLFSLSIAGLVASFSLFVALVTTIARRWVFGSVFCTINTVPLTLNLFLVSMIHLAISRDRYNAVKDPLHWQYHSNRAYIYTTIIWSITLGYTVIRQIWSIPQQNIGDNIFASCFFAPLAQKGQGEQRKLIITIMIIFSYSTTISASVLTLGHYVLILKKMYLLNRIPSSIVLRVNERGNPLECTTREHTAKSLAAEEQIKSLAISYLIQATCFTLAFTLIAIRTIHSFIEQAQIDQFIHPAEFALWYNTLLFPAVNPAVLILSNKRLRNRVKGLLKCEPILETESRGTLPLTCEAEGNNPLPNTTARDSTDDVTSRKTFVAWI